MSQKMNLWITAASLSLMMISGAYAADPVPPAGANRPCEQIKKACEGAGFFKNGHKKDHKGLWVDCFKPVMAGQSVPGVTVDGATIQACQAKKASRKQS